MMHISHCMGKHSTYDFIYNQRLLKMKYGIQKQYENLSKNSSLHISYANNKPHSKFNMHSTH